MAGNLGLEELTMQSVVKLRSGYDMPVLGYGVWQVPSKDAQEVCLKALEMGYRHIDSAAVYGNEEGCGAAILASGVPREQVFFTSKIMSPKDMNHDAAAADIDRMLKVTGLGYIDLVLLHAPYGGSEGRKGAWLALVEAVEAGKVRSIGVSNYGPVHLAELDDYIAELQRTRPGSAGGGVVSVGQWESHPWCQRGAISDWCRARGVVFEAYSPLVRGRRWGDERLRRVAERVGKTEAQVLIRWNLQSGQVPLPKSVTPERIRENTGVFGWELSLEDLKDLNINEYKPECWDPTQSGLEDRKED